VEGLAQTALDALRTHGEIALLVVLFLGAMGVPVPATPAIIAMGALARAGDVAIWSSVLAAMVGTSLGDGASYAIGRRGFPGIIERLRRRKAWRKAEAKFCENAATSLFFSRWLVTPLAFPMTLIAGGERYPFPRFLLWSALGHVVWVMAYGALGYAFASAWPRVAGQVQSYAPWIAGAVVLAVAGVVVWRQRAPRSTPEPDA